MRVYIHICLCMCLISCASMESLKINQVNDCLKIDEDINVVSKCIRNINEYEYIGEINRGYIDLYRVKDYCDKEYRKNCSHIGLVDSFLIGSREVKEFGSNKIIDEIKIIKNQYKLYISKSQNLGGRLIMLYVFYNKKEKVIGWVNLGSIINKYNFNHEMKKNGQ